MQQLLNSVDQISKTAFKVQQRLGVGLIKRQQQVLLQILDVWRQAVYGPVSTIEKCAYRG